MIKTIAFILILGGPILLAAQTAPTQNPLLRSYRDGEKLTYRMKAVNENWHYEIQANGIVKRDAAGTYFEEYAWSDLISDNQKAVLSPASLAFRQQLSLDPNHNPSIPNFGQAEPKLIGPVTDFMTFYVDVWLAVKTGHLTQAGDHFYVQPGVPTSWADGTHMLVAEDAIDFDLTLKDINHADNTVTLVARHVPPQKSSITLPADWMRQPVSGTANNWVQVEKTKEGRYRAGVGKEIFTVEVKLSLTDGKILSGSMDNTVETMECECEDAALTNCSDLKPHQIKRQVQISLAP